MYPTLLALADDLLHRGGAAVSIDGRTIPLAAADSDPFGLLGVRFGPAVDAVAFALGSGAAEPGDSPVLAVDRAGEAVVVDARRQSTAVREAPLVLDLARRAMGLATAPPDRPVADLVDAVWLDRALRTTLDAPLGEPPSWVALARLHPGGGSGPPASPEILRYRATSAPDWHRLRAAVVHGSVRWPPVSATLALWFDPGSLSRHTLAVLPDPATLLADLHELLRPSDAARVDAALSRP